MYIDKVVQKITPTNACTQTSNSSFSHLNACSSAFFHSVSSCPAQYTGDRCELLAGTDVSTSSPQSTVSPGISGGLSAGAIVGIVLGVLAGLILLALGGYYYKKKSQ